MSAASTTPYEGQRRRVALMEKLEALRLGVPASIARRNVARDTALSPDQLVAIRKRRPKDLYGEIKNRIDAAFIGYAEGCIHDLEHELVVARQGARGVDPGLVSKAQASVDALEQLIAEAARRPARDCLSPSRDGRS